MSDTPQSIELEVEVIGTPEEVWQAIATGPGITSWYVPHEVEERAGGETSASFGPGMDISGRVAEWDPPRRVVLDGGDGGDGLAFEWMIEARDNGTCIVRLVNSGFGSGGEWDDQYDGMTEGWQIFLRNLQLHLEHFSDQVATPILPMAIWAGPREAAWRSLTDALGLPAAPAEGDHIATDTADAPPLAGKVVGVAPHRISLLLDEPAPGTGFLAAEGYGDQISVSVWLYLYGDAAAEVAPRDDSAWRRWLEARAPST